MKRRYIVGYSRKTHLFARLIMWFTRSDKSHCYIRQESDGVDYVLEATSRGVNNQWHSVFLRDGAHVVVEFEVLVDVEVLDEAWSVTQYDKLNQPYSWAQIVGDAWVIFVKKITGKLIRNPLGQPWKDVCSELVLYFVRKAGIVGYERLDLETVSPEDIFEIMKNDRQFRQIDVHV